MQVIADPIAEKRDAFAERLFNASLEAFDIVTVYLGDKLGYYDALTENGSMTSTQLAAVTGTYERYAREWLEQQAKTGILEVEDANAPVESRRFRLPGGHDEVLADRESLNYLAPLAQVFIGAVSPIDQLVSNFRTGGGIPFEDFGVDMREGQSRMNRNMFLYELGQEYLPSIPDVHARLQSTEPARVADVGCGTGWSSIGMAQSYPNIRVDGYDLDAASIEDARKNVAEANLTDRVRFEHRDAGDLELAGLYDLVTAFECIHDMPDPVSVLRSMRQLAKPGGAVIVMDERVADTFTPEVDDVERFMYGFSVVHCLPAGLSDAPSVATGTVMRTGTFESYAREAGFTDVEVLPIDNFFFRFYRLR